MSPDDIPTRIEFSYVSRISPLTGNTILLGEDDAAAVIAHHWPAIERHIREQVAQEIEATSASRLDAIDELDRNPSDWDRHQEWCDAAAIARNGTKES